MKLTETPMQVSVDGYVNRNHVAQICEVLGKTADAPLARQLLRLLHLSIEGCDKFRPRIKELVEIDPKETLWYRLSDQLNSINLTITKDTKSPLGYTVSRSSNALSTPVICSKVLQDMRV